MKRFISASLSVCLVLACSGFESLALIQDEDVPQETVELVTEGDEVDSDEAASDEEETAPAEPSETEAATEAEPTETEAEPTESEPVETEAVVTEAPEETEQAQEEETTPAETAESTEEVSPEVTEETEETVASEETTETAAPETTAETTEEEIVAPTPTEGPSLDIEDEEPQEEEPEIQSVSWDGETFSNVYEDDLVRVTFKLINVWTTGYNASVKIENLSDKAIENWGLSFDFGGEIATIWNAKITSQAAGQLTVKNAGWNQDIPAGSSVEFGMQGSEEFCGFPETYKILGSICAVSEENFSVDYVLDSDWDEGFSAALILTNTSEEALEDWTLEFDYARNITELWNGALISHEGDHYVIKNADYNANINPGESVRIGFNGTDGLPEDVPTNFKLTIIGDKADAVDMDKVVVHKAYGDVQIGYTNGDSQYNVKHNLFLDTEVDGATVTWTSSDAGVVDAAGNVYRLYDESVLINLTATISSGEFSMEKSFEIRVIKSMYDDFSTDEIYVLERMSQLYYYNDIEEDLSYYTNDLGYLRRVTGSISDIIVDSPDEAMFALFGVQELMGMTDLYSEVVPAEITKADCMYIYNFTQVYNGVPVSGSSISVVTDATGNTIGLISSYVPIDISTTPAISSEAALASVQHNGIVSEPQLTIWVADGVAKLVWVIRYEDTNGDPKFSYIDAQTGSVALQGDISQGMDGTTVDGSYGDRTFDVTESDSYESSTTYYLYDLTRNISSSKYTYDSDYDTLGNIATSTDPNNWSGQAVAVRPYYYAQDCYDYYQTNFSVSGYGAGSSIYVLYDWNDDNAEHCRSVNNSNDHLLKFGNGSNQDWGENPLIVAHEYTHGIVSIRTHLADDDRTQEARAIDEAYADIMSYLINGEDMWVVRFPNGNSRNSVNPRYSSYASFLASDQEEHDGSTVLSHVVYLMKSRGISDERLAKLVMGSLHSYSSHATFLDVKENFMLAAWALGFSDEEQIMIDGVFDLMGISSEPETNTSEFSINGKVREAMLNLTTIEYRDLQGATVSIRRQSNTSDYADPVTTNYRGLYSFDGIRAGKYVLTFAKDGYLTATMNVSILNDTNVYVDTVDLIKFDNSTSMYGNVRGQVTDAATGEPVAGLTIRVRKGWGRTGVNDPIYATVTTNADGYYDLINYEMGYYTLQVSDLRPGVTDKYSTNFKNVVVFGNGYTATHQDIAVSNSLSRNQVRIVLEWNATPRDLDSHMYGISDFVQKFEIAYYSKLYGSVVALDLDDVNGYGPETTTIYTKTEDEYLFFVYNFSNDGSITSSGATVKVYFGVQTVPTYVFNVPASGSGRYWTVFKYVPDDGNRVRPINYIGTSPKIVD